MTNLEFYKYLPRFKLLTVEQEFRASFLKQDQFLARIVILGAILVSLASIIPDSLSQSTSESLRGLYLSTFIFCLFSSIVLKVLSAALRYRQIDLITTGWWLSVIIAVTVGNTLYPPNLTIHVVFDVLIPVAIYLLIPIGLISQFSLAVLFTVANLGLLFFLKENLSQADMAFILTAFAATHLLGIMSCWQTHVGRRMQFAEMKSEQLLRGELQETLNELKTLRGIIPICCYCKQIRDDEGYWHQVETYIKMHSEADFTHGICPKCLEVHTPKIFDRFLASNSHNLKQGNDE